MYFHHILTIDQKINFSKFKNLSFFNSWYFSVIDATLGIGTEESCRLYTNDRYQDYHKKIEVMKSMRFCLFSIFLHLRLIRCCTKCIFKYLLITKLWPLCCYHCTFTARLTFETVSNFQFLKVNVSFYLQR